MVFGTFSILHQKAYQSDPASEASECDQVWAFDVRIWGRPRRAGRFKSSKSNSYIKKLFVMTGDLCVSWMRPLPYGLAELVGTRCVRNFLWWNPARTDLLLWEKKQQGTYLVNVDWHCLARERKFGISMTMIPEKSKQMWKYRSTLPSSVYQREVANYGKYL